MARRIFILSLVALTAVSGQALAQVPPDIAEGIRKIGPIVDSPGTAKLYAPLFADQKEPYPNVTITRDIAMEKILLKSSTFSQPAPQRVRRGRS